MTSNVNNEQTVNNKGRKTQFFPKAPASTEAELAHRNLIAINRDLQKQIGELKQSSSYRIGQKIVHLVRPFLLLIGRRHRSSSRPTIAIESLWPCLRGTITFKQPSTQQSSIAVFIKEHILLSKVLNFADYAVSIPEYPSTVEFEFVYQLGFDEFSREDLEIAVDGIPLKNADRDFEEYGSKNVCRPLDVAISSLRTIDGDLADFRSKMKMARGVALLAMFRDSNRLGDNSQDLINELRDLGLLTIVVDTSETQPAIPISCDVYIHRLNVGWDFASWMSVLGKYPWITEESENLLLINDSNVGPLKPLKNLFDLGHSKNFDVWGITDSWEIHHHIQSYFLFFGRTGLSDGHLQEFVSHFSFPIEKNSIIHSGEIGLSRFLSQRGLRIGAVFPYSTLTQMFVESFPNRMAELQNRQEIELQMKQGPSVANYERSFALSTAEQIRCATPLNPTHYFWDVLLELGSPFIKRELLSNNPERVPGLNRISQIISDPGGRAALQKEVDLCGKACSTFSLALAMSLDNPSDDH